MKKKLQEAKKVVCLQRATNNTMGIFLKSTRIGQHSILIVR